MTIDELLETYRDVFAMTELEKGERFERLMKNFLLTYPVWRGTVAEVWRWKDFPFRHELGGKDLGIDLVAKTVGGDYWAAQCKFYADTSTVTKDAVDSFISNSGRTFGGGQKFSRRLWISTTDLFTDNAREMLKNQSPEVEIINLAMLRRVQINWALLDNGFSRDDARIVRKLRDYQQAAVDAAIKYYADNSRGQLIMACGTGKTFTALKIAEQIAPDGKILFLVPSISLLAQTLEEWATFADKPINALCICSDVTAAQIDDDIIDVNLPLPAMTDAEKISAALKNFPTDKLTVVFSTYQSIEVVNKLGVTFDLAICDEAHRTAVALNEMQRIELSAAQGSDLGENSIFTAVHDENFIRAHRRMYMTATPKHFKTDAKDYAAENDLTLWSMDDENIFGREFFTITFAQARDGGYLTDYKVLIFTVDETLLTARLKQAVNDKNESLTVDNALKIVGCINALSKKLDKKSARLVADDTNAFMHTAVAFCKTIADAEHFAKDFDAVQEKYFADMSDDDRKTFVNVAADFVYGSRKVGSKSVAMSAVARAAKLQRLKSTPIDGNACTVLHNVRCLSEGVDVPALDAIIFLASKRSEVEIVQAVGRVMRNAPHKKFGYIIIPVVVPLSKSAEDALDRNAEFKDVWRIINALRTHDHALTIEVERLRSTGETEKIIVTPGESADNRDDAESADKPVQLSLLNFLRWDDFKDKIYARMVEHVGDKLYWISWAYKVADIVERHTRRITELVAAEGVHKSAFDEFLDGLRRNLNPAVTAAEAVDMLAQHLITRPVFEGLFENYSFAANNPVSQAMQKILDALEGDGLTKDREIFARLYKQVRDECSNMGDAANRQRIITRLYESFFSIALKKTSDKLGIVYTPVEVVDFILRSVDAVLRKYFNRGLTDENVHVLDPFAGTGTFLVRLIQSDLIRAEDLPRKYRRELHANELVLLAYYIAAINIENAFANACDKTYRPFDGICFTDTFQLYERGQQSLALGDVLKVNSERVNSQQAAPIEVIVGNPPYRVGQGSANDDAQNQKYDNLERRIAATYAKGVNSTLKKSLYDSYIKAFRWASDRIKGGGVIGFVTNANWIDKDAMSGLRKCFAKEFSAIYVFNLRGDIRNKEKFDAARDGGNVFDIMTGVAITILVKHGAHVGDAQIFYRDIGTYLTRAQKLNIINRTPNVLSDDFRSLTPNKFGDWINQRGELFYTFPPIEPTKKFDGKSESFFVTYSLGISTNRDTWCYNFSQAELERNMRTTIDYYNTHDATDVDATKFVWSSSAVANKNRKLKYKFNAAQIVESIYRPFCKENLYFDELLNDRRGQMPQFFPHGNDDNLLICVSGASARKNFSALIVDKIACLDMVEAAQCFPLYWYERSAQGNLFGDEYQRRDGVSDFILQRARELYGDVEREDIFYYVYGFLHLPSYRERFANELKKSLPRIILVADAEKFRQLSQAGRDLAEIHLNYESQPFADVEVIGTEHGDFRVDKLRFAKDDRTTLIYNRHIKIRNIPPRSFEYVVNGRSPLEWIIDRYRVKTDKSSGIVNDANAWGVEHGNPRYILDLILSCITVSLRTLEIVDNLPSVEFGT